MLVRIGDHSQPNQTCLSDTNEYQLRFYCFWFSHVDHLPQTTLHEQYHLHKSSEEAYALHTHSVERSFVTDIAAVDSIGGDVVLVVDAGIAVGILEVFRIVVHFVEASIID